MYLHFSGSLRQDSLNLKLARVSGEILRGLSGEEIDFLSLKELNLPVYDGDLEAAGMPGSLNVFVEQIRQARGLVISSPEYNGSIAGSLKNALDWSSRIKPNPWMGKRVLLLSASPGALGGIRGLWHSRQPFEAMGAHVYPEMFALGSAHQAFSVTGELTDSKTKERLQSLLLAFHRFVMESSQSV